MPHASFRRAIAIGLGLLLVFPAGMVPAGALPAAASTPIGTLRCRGTVYLGGDLVRTESVIYSGDKVKTGDGEAVVSLARSDLMVVDRNSATVLSRSPAALLIGLEAGQLAWAASSQLPVHVQADGLTLSPMGAFPTLAEVALKADGSLAVAVHRGKISVADLRAEPVVVSAGQLLTVGPRLAQAEKSRPVGTGAHGKMTLGEKLRTFHIGGLSHTASVVVVAGVVGGAAATAIVVPLVVGEEVSPSAP